MVVSLKHASDPLEASQKRSLNVAVVGATGAVGRKILELLAERSFPVKDIFVLASSRSAGTQLSFSDHQTLKVQPLERFDFGQVDIAFFSPGSAVSRRYVPKALEAGCWVVDNTSCFRHEAPLIVPEVNGHILEDLMEKESTAPSGTVSRLISNPNCVAIPLAVVCKALSTLAPIKRVVVSSYQSVSGAGKEAIHQLWKQTRDILTNLPVKREVFEKQIAFNVIPLIGPLEQDGSSEEERKIRQEMQKILGTNLGVAVTCARVPVFIGHAMSLALEFDLDLLRERGRDEPGHHVALNLAEEKDDDDEDISFEIDDKAGPSKAQVAYTLGRTPGVTPIRLEDEETQSFGPMDVSGEDAIYVSRLRRDPSVPSGFLMWVTSDNLRKGAALNAVQIGEKIVEHFTKKSAIPVGTEDVGN